MEVLVDDKWKLCKKGCRREGGSLLQASSSTRERTKSSEAAATRTIKRSFSRRCAGLVKEQRARFYIARRCVTMLLCWRDYP